MGFDSFKTAADMRDAIMQIAESAVKKLAPTPRIGQVTDINRVNYRAQVSLAGDEGSMPVRFTPSLQPRTIGSIVRIAGKPGDYYIADILNEPAVHETYEAVAEVVPTPDGVPPSESPVPTLRAGVRALFVTWDEVVNSSPVTYDVYAWTDTSAIQAVDPTNLVKSVIGGEIALIKQLADGTALDPATVYYVSIVARDEDGSAPASAPVSGSPALINSDDIVAEAVTAEKIASDYVYAGQITAEQLQAALVAAEVVLGGQFVTSLDPQRMEISSDGLITYDANGNPVVEITPAGSTFRGDAEIDNLTVKTLTTLQETLLATGSKMTLQTGITAPSNPPTVKLDYEKVTATGIQKLNKKYLSTGFYDPVNGGAYSHGFCIAGGLIYFIVSAAGIVDINDEWHVSATEVRTVPLAGGVSTPLNVQDNYTPIDITSYGANFCCLRGNYDTDAMGNPLLYHTFNITPAGNTTGTEYQLYNGNNNNEALTGIYWDGTNFWVAGVTYEGAGVNGYVFVDRYTSTFGGRTRFTSTYTSANNGKGDTDLGWGLYVGNGDFGAQKIVIPSVKSGDAGAKVFTISGTTLVRDANNDFQAAGVNVDSANNAIAITWDGTQFWGIQNWDVSGGTSTIYKYSGIKWTTEPNTWYASYIWRRDNPVYFTPESPRKTFTMVKRTRLSLTSAKIPNNGAATDPNQVYFYVGRTTPVANTNMFQNATPNPGITTVTLTSVAFSGANAPATNTFLGSTPAALHSAGDEVIVDGAGNVTFNKAPKFATTGGATGGAMLVESGNPQINFHETDAPVGGAFYYWLHNNSGNFFLLQDRTGDGVWDAPHPFYVTSDGVIHPGFPLDLANEVWRTVGAAGQPGWKNGFSAFSEAVQFRRDAAGNVHMRGRVRVGTSGTAAFTLPAGYRPTATYDGLSVSGNGQVSCTCRIDTTGDVNFWFPSGVTNVGPQPIFSTL